MSSKQPKNAKSANKKINQEPGEVQNLRNNNQISDKIVEEKQVREKSTNKRKGKKQPKEEIIDTTVPVAPKNPNDNSIPNVANDLNQIPRYISPNTILPQNMQNQPQYHMVQPPIPNNSSNSFTKNTIPNMFNTFPVIPFDAQGNIVNPYQYAAQNINAAQKDAPKSNNRPHKKDDKHINSADNPSMMLSGIFPMNYQGGLSNIGMFNYPVANNMNVMPFNNSANNENVENSKDSNKDSISQIDPSISSDQSPVHYSGINKHMKNKNEIPKNYMVLTENTRTQDGIPKRERKYVCQKCDLLVGNMHAMINHMADEFVKNPFKHPLEYIKPHISLQQFLLLKAKIAVKEILNAKNLDIKEPDKMNILLNELVFSENTREYIDGFFENEYPRGPSMIFCRVDKTRIREHIKDIYKYLKRFNEVLDTLPLVTPYRSLSDEDLKNIEFKYKRDINLNYDCFHPLQFTIHKFNDNASDHLINNKKIKALDKDDDAILDDLGRSNNKKRNNNLNQHLPVNKNVVNNYPVFPMSNYPVQPIPQINQNNQHNSMLNNIALGTSNNQVIGYGGIMDNSNIDNLVNSNNNPNNMNNIDIPNIQINKNINSINNTNMVPALMQNTNINQIPLGNVINQNALQGLLSGNQSLKQNDVPKDKDGDIEMIDQTEENNKKKENKKKKKADKKPNIEDFIINKDNTTSENVNNIDYGIPQKFRSTVENVNQNVNKPKSEIKSNIFAFNANQHIPVYPIIQPNNQMIPNIQYNKNVNTFLNPHGPLYFRIPVNNNVEDNVSYNANVDKNIIDVDEERKEDNVDNKGDSSEIPAKKKKKNTKKSGVKKNRDSSKADEPNMLSKSNNDLVASSNNVDKNVDLNKFFSGSKNVSSYKSLTNDKNAFSVKLLCNKRKRTGKKKGGGRSRKKDDNSEDLNEDEESVDNENGDKENVLSDKCAPKEKSEDVARSGEPKSAEGKSNKRKGKKKVNSRKPKSFKKKKLDDGTSAPVKKETDAIKDEEEQKEDSDDEDDDDDYNPEEDGAKNKKRKRVKKK